jgi:hypothetical protein
MVKPFRDWRLEAQALNTQAQAQGKPEPIPNYTHLRLKPLARKVLQARLDAGQGRGDGY